MFVSLNWMRDFLDLPNQPDSAISDLITVRTAEIESIVHWGLIHPHLLIVKVTACEPLAEGKANRVTIDIGSGKSETVVCGAPNVRVGLKTVFAPPGTKMTNGEEVKPVQKYGMVSNGFLCSEAEAHLGTDQREIVELDADAPVGKSLHDFYPDARDTVIEIDNKSLTHRPDLWCQYGFAREIATIFRVPLKNPFTPEWESKILSKGIKAAEPVTIEVQSTDTCLGYCGMSIDRVSCKQSPGWMRHRLARVGVRPVSDIVDIGNYVMLELGIPLHLFDREAIRGSSVIIHKLDAPTDLPLLDGSTAKLLAGDTVVADSQGPLVLAGIMGGERSGVRDATNKLFLEVANWRPAAVRKTSLRIGVRTESSLRYEKSLDSQLMKRTAIRALELVQKFNPEAHVVGNLLSVAVPKPESAVVSVTVSYDKINKVLGTEVPREEIDRIFTSLGFALSKANDILTVKVPSYRATKDISCDMDLIEEIGRLWGYEQIKPTAPLGQILPVRIPPVKQLQRVIRDFMAGHARALEIMTYPLVGRELLERAFWPVKNDKLALQNPWSEEFDRMRPSIIPSALQALALNQKSYPSFRFFELGRSYHVDPKGFCTEREELLFAFFNRDQTEFVEALDICEHLMSRVHRFDVQLAPMSDSSAEILPIDWQGLHPKRAQELRSSKGTVGVVCELTPNVLQSFKIRGSAVIGVVPLESMVESLEFDSRLFTPINHFPSTSFDLTLVAAERDEVDDILTVARKPGTNEPLSAGVVSVFPLPNGEKAVTIRVTARKADGTLSNEEIQSLQQAVTEKLAERGFMLRK